MPVELKVPSAGESITQVQIGEWKIAEGGLARRDQVVVEIETDKATMEVPAPITGKVVKVLKKAGQTAKIGEVIGMMEEAAGAPAEKAAAPSKTPAVAPDAAASAKPAPGGAASESTGHIMPAARRVMSEHGVQPGQVAGTGPGGRVLKEDVERHVAGGAANGAGAAPAAERGTTAAPAAERGTSAAPAAERGTTAAPAAERGASGAPAAERAVSAGREEDIVPMTMLRRRVAERLVAAQQHAALLTTFNEIDMAAVLAQRKERGDSFLAKHGVKLGFMSFFVKAAVDALRLVPQINAEVREVTDADGKPAPAVAFRNYYDIGVAVGGGKGLVVPVLRSAERMSFAEVEKSIADFGARARENKLTLEELQGGTFTISNGGIYGSLLSTPIVNPPQSGILGLHAIQERPVARDGQVVIRPMMYVALTYDHRIVDGREAVTFLKRIKECVEDPARMLIEI